MEREAVHEYFIHNGSVKSTSDDMHVFDNINESAVYEVMKIYDGIPLYFNEHLKRMKKSLMVFNVKMNKSDDEILKEIIKLVKINNFKFINVKLVYDFSKEENSFLTYFIKSEYPGEEKYKNGVHTLLFQGERKNPNIKTLSGSFRKRVQEAREEKNAYEALLVDGSGYITEGSRSNIFFIKGNEILTPPGGKVLLGVTRSYVLKICKELNIKVKEELIKTTELKDIQGAFITGTTVDVLPILSVDDVQLSTISNKIMQRIIYSYKKLMKENIEELKEYIKSKAIIER